MAIRPINQRIARARIIAQQLPELPGEVQILQSLLRPGWRHCVNNGIRLACHRHDNVKIFAGSFACVIRWRRLPLYTGLPFLFLATVLFTKLLTRTSGCIGRRRDVGRPAILTIGCI